MSVFSQFETSKVLEEEGIIVKLKPNDDKTIPTFKIGRACRSNKRYTKTFEAKIRPFKDDIANETIADEKAHEINVDVFASSLLYGWSNVQDKDGKDIPFSRENALKLFKDLPELYEFLNAKSNNMANFLEANLKADEKN